MSKCLHDLCSLSFKRILISRDACNSLVYSNWQIIRRIMKPGEFKNSFEQIRIAKSKHISIQPYVYSIRWEHTSIHEHVPELLIITKYLDDVRKFRRRTAKQVLPCFSYLLYAMSLKMLLPSVVRKFKEAA